MKYRDHLRPKLVAAWALVGLAACGRIGFDDQRDAGLADDAAIPPPPPTFVDGTRLRAVRAVAAGVERFEGWFDTEIGERCRFMSAADGLQRCLPDALRVDTYSDAACTVAMATQYSDGATCGTAAYATSLDGRVHAVTGPVGGQRYQLQGTICAAVGSTGVTSLAIGAEVPSAMFVAGTEQSTTRAGAVSYRELVADDGARLVQPRLYDHVHDQVCAIPQGDTAARPCLDRTRLSYGFPAFADATCATPLLVVVAAGAQPRATLQRSTLCVREERVFELGAPHTGQVYERTPTGCGATALDPARAAFAQGADVTAEYPRLEPYATTAAGRIGELRWRSVDGIDVQDIELFWDHQTGAVCGPIVDDQTRTTVCAPVWTTNSAGVYSDAGCTTPAGSVTSACRTAHAAIHFPPFGPLVSTCDGFTTAPSVYDQPFGPGSAYEWTGTACQPIDQTLNPLFTLNPSSTAFQAADYVPVTFVR